MLAETQEGSVAVLWNNCFYFTQWLLIFKSLFLYLQTHQDLPCLPWIHRPEDIQTGRKASRSAPYSPGASPTSSHHLTVHPAMPSVQDRWIFHEKAARLTILKGIPGQQRRNWPHRRPTKASLIHLWHSTRGRRGQNTHSVRLTRQQVSAFLGPNGVNHKRYWKFSPWGEHKSGWIAVFLQSRITQGYFLFL